MHELEWSSTYKQLHISLYLRPGVKDINIGKNRLFTKKTLKRLDGEIAKGYKLSYVWEIAWSVFMLLSLLCGPLRYTPGKLFTFFLTNFMGSWLLHFSLGAFDSQRTQSMWIMLVMLWTLWCPLSQEWHFIYFLLEKIWKFVLLLFGGGVARFTPKFGSVTAWGQIKLCCAV